MKSLGDVIAEPPQKEDEFTCLESEFGDVGLVRRGSLDSVDRVSLSSSTTSSSVLSGGTELGNKTLRSLKRGLGKLWRRHRGNASITEYDPSYKVAYLGNVLTGWAKGDGCVEKPVSTLWRNYVGSSRPDVMMRLTITNGGLTAATKDHGITEYWAHRVTYCTAPVSHPRLFVWVYRHEGRRMRPELRCHAALCAKESTARRLASVLNARLQQALLEFRRDKVSRQNARLSLANACYENPSLPRRKLLLSTGGSNYRPPLERSKSAPKLSAIEEDAVAEEIEQQRFLEELRSLERVACSWQDQEGWRLARLLDALHRESSDENGSISSGCETASTANSEERVSSIEDSHLPHELDITNGQRTNGEALTEAMTAKNMTAPSTPPLCSPMNGGPRRNSEGSPNFMTCSGSPYFRRRPSRPTRVRPRCTLVSTTSSRSEGEESMEDEDDENEKTMVVIADTNMTNTLDNRFEFEDVEDLDDIVDFRPHGESPRSSGCSQTGTRLQNDGYAAMIARRDDMRKLMSSRCTTTSCPMSMDEVDSCIHSETTSITDEKTTVKPVDMVTSTTPEVINYHALGSLDEEDQAADSDESGYVEASPKNSIDRTELNNHNNNNNQESNNNKSNHQDKREIYKTNPADHAAEFIKCPISETIKKLANASLRSSKGIRMPPNACLESLSSGNVTRPEIDGESPSLLQRKRLLAQQGVMV